jgi:hypothetical protein
VVAGRQHHRVGLQVAPRVARGVCRAVDTDEGPEAVVGVHAEREDTSHVFDSCKSIGVVPRVGT